MKSLFFTAILFFSLCTVGKADAIPNIPPGSVVDPLLKPIKFGSGGKLPPKETAGLENSDPSKINGSGDESPGPSGASLKEADAKPGMESPEGTVNPPGTDPTEEEVATDEKSVGGGRGTETDPAEPREAATDPLDAKTGGVNNLAAYQSILPRLAEEQTAAGRDTKKLGQIFQDLQKEHEQKATEFSRQAASLRKKETSLGSLTEPGLPVLPPASFAPPLQAPLPQKRQNAGIQLAESLEKKREILLETKEPTKEDFTKLFTPDLSGPLKKPVQTEKAASTVSVKTEEKPEKLAQKNKGKPLGGGLKESLKKKLEASLAKTGKDAAESEEKLEESGPVRAIASILGSEGSTDDVSYKNPTGGSGFSLAGSETDRIVNGMVSELHEQEILGENTLDLFNRVRAAHDRFSKRIKKI